MAAGKSCSRCDGRMEEGFMVDVGNSIHNVGKWHRGAPLLKWWGLKVKKQDMLSVTSWRCNRCGLLENYAG